MSVHKVYRFATSKQWELCSRRGFEAEGDTLVPVRPLGPHAAPTGTSSALSAVAADPYDNPIWRIAASCLSGQTGALGWMDEFGQVHGPIWVDKVVDASPRLVLDRQWLWAFDSTAVRRYDRETFQSDRTMNLGDLHDEVGAALHEIVDIASDGRDGVWLLAATAGPHVLLHLDCRGCVASRHTIPETDVVPEQIGTLECGKVIVLLSVKPGALMFVASADGSLKRDLPIEQVVPGMTVTRFATDRRGRIVLGGICNDNKWRFVILDALGELVHPPFTDLFGGRAKGAIDFTFGRTAMWFATESGLWRLADDGAEESAATTATLITPMLMSPTGERRGWSRAELTMDLPKGAALEASYVSTNDANLARQAAAALNDTHLTVARRQDLIWRLLGGDETPGRTFAVAGSAGSDGPIAVPLFGTEDQWLWLRLRVHVPASARSPRLTELRVLYPEITLMERLPEMFEGPDNDPGGVLRRFVGGLEATTQNIDAAIRGIGRQLEADHTPDTWLDYLGHWLDLPWHDALPAAMKRALLGGASGILSQRGTRAGLLALLHCLVGKKASVSITDVTVEFAPMRLGGSGRRGAPVPGLLAGRRVGNAALGERAKIGAIRLGCPPTDCNPLAAIVPTLRILLTVPAAVRRDLAPLLPAILEQFVPFGLRMTVRWRIAPEAAFNTGGEMVLDGEGPGEIGGSSIIGRTVLSGRGGGRIMGSGFEMSLRLR